MKKKILSLAFCLLCVAQVISQTRMEPAEKFEGKTLPDVVLLDRQLDLVHLHSLFDNGKPAVVLLYFNCSPCNNVMKLLSLTTQEELNELNVRFDRNYKVSDYQLVFLNMQPDENFLTTGKDNHVGRFFANDEVIRLCPNPIVLYAENRECSKLFSAQRFPLIYFIDRNGIVKEELLGYGPNDNIAVLDALERIIADSTDRSSLPQHRHTEARRSERKRDGETDKWGLIDANGNWVVTPRFRYIYPFENGIAIVIDEKKGAIDTCGKTIIPSIYDSVENYQNFIRVKNGKSYGLYRCDGSEILPCIYEDIFYNEGTYKVTLNNAYGLYAEDGRKILDCKYEYIAQTDDELLMVELNDKKGFVDRNGHIAIDLIYDDAMPFYGKSTTTATFNGISGILDRSGNFTKADTESDDLKNLLWLLAQ